jgi:peptide methionine sulfoxide reductase msrA/msrB
MSRALSTLTAALLLTGCSSAEGTPDTSESPEMKPQSANPSTDAAVNTATAYFAGGCFWGVEHYMQQLDGVIEVESGYMGGHIDNPTYQQVSSQTSGHYETVRVTYDPAKIEYKAIAKRFYEIHDPTQKDGQGPDIGPEYESAVFFSSEEEKADNEALIALLRKRGYDVATKLIPAKTFYMAEEHHQDYYQRKGKEPYCHARIKRFED